VQVPVTSSAGVATYPDDARMAETLTAQADAALYRAKAAGRDRVM
jgi:diguanylate cyclase (GGDEF)-like protein